MVSIFTYDMVIKKSKMLITWHENCTIMNKPKQELTSSSSRCRFVKKSIKMHWFNGKDQEALRNNFKNKLVTVMHLI